MPNADQYLIQMQALLPLGDAWPRDPDAVLTLLLAGIAGDMARVDGRCTDLIEETDPRTTLELLSEWEAFAGLPDACTASVATSLGERRRSLWAALTQKDGLSLNYFQRLAERLGYSVTIIGRGRPFICGRSRCGHVLGGGHIERLVWRVTINGPRIQRFRCGSSRAGDRLTRIVRATDLECLLRRMNPAHLELVIAYQD
ncbi:YmfQ family protein [Desulfovibrio psychrotolerans]|uniref:Tail protein n=1 Tax=Desulfovibrio psychrotolerans TaxID=415242 RepID=A0A7J0BVC6_9BACT|nr:putative phage tail protein [Desulfovibrio psychrotolerans]GFM37669.1 tail protein [Desulfovibrio psychrotolerans]